MDGEFAPAPTEKKRLGRPPGVKNGQGKGRVRGKKMQTEPRARDSHSSALTRVQNSNNEDLDTRGQFTEQFIEAKRVIDKALQATKRVWSAQVKDFIEVPDWQARLKAAEMAAHYEIGKPVERSLHITQNADATPEKVVETMLASPEAREQLRRMLDAAEKPALEGS